MSEVELSILRDLKARADINDALVRLARGLDRLDRDLALSAYHDDGWDSHGTFDGPAASFVDWAIDIQRERFVWTSHYLSNVHIELDRDVAAVESYVQAIMRFERDGELFDISGCGRYLDRFELRSDAWKIAHRHVIADWNRVDPVHEQMDRAVADALTHGTRSIDDPSYAYFTKTAPGGSPRR